MIYIEVHEDYDFGNALAGAIANDQEWFTYQEAFCSLKAFDKSYLVMVNGVAIGWVRRDVRK